MKKILAVLVLLSMANSVHADSKKVIFSTFKLGSSPIGESVELPVYNGQLFVVGADFSRNVLNILIQIPKAKFNYGPSESLKMEMHTIGLNDRTKIGFVWSIDKDKHVIVSVFTHCPKRGCQLSVP